MLPLILHSKKTVPWYLRGLVPPANCIAAYQAQGAASLAASYINLVNPGTNDLTAPMAAPTWDTVNGWHFDGIAQYLETGISIAEGYTFLCTFSEGVFNKFLCGAYTNPRGFGYAIRNVSSNAHYWSGSSLEVPPLLLSGVIGVSGAQGYRNGVADGAALAAWGGTITATFAIGKLGGYASYFPGCIQYLAIYNTPLSSAHMLAVSNAMKNNMLVVFGDSVTSGTGATDEAHRWANIVATARGWLLRNSGLSSTTLQNTVQNTVAVIGGAVTNNGRDTFPTRVVPYYPKHVIILYGMNDIRLNDVAYTSTLFGNCLGEVIDGLVSAGTSPNNILVCSPPYVPDDNYSDPTYSPWDGGSVSDAIEHNSVCSSVAASKGTKYVDIYLYMHDNGGDTLISADGIHPNDAGHAAIAAAILSEL